MEVVSRQLPRYKCHKEVWALKIESIEIKRPTIEELDSILNGEEERDAAIITPVDKNCAPFGVSSEYLRKHNPQPGGYYVVYEDGYRSYSPAKAFDDGYTLILEK